MTELREDRWHIRDFPVLLEVARLIDNGRAASSEGVAETLGLDGQDVGIAFLALTPTYIRAKIDYDGGGGMFGIATELTERGRRSTGLWPQEDDAAAALVELLNQAADSTDDDDDAGALRKAGRLLKSVPGSVLSDVTAALIRQQTGL
jgi:hypothetical protein